MAWLSKEPRKIQGRPMKYDDLLAQLSLDDLFSPAAIAAFACESNYIDAKLDPRKRALTKRRIRITLGRLTKNRNFPPEGDGMIRLPKQAPVPAWFGWRWRLAAKGIRHQRQKMNDSADTDS